MNKFFAPLAYPIIDFFKKIKFMPMDQARYSRKIDKRFKGKLMDEEKEAIFNNLRREDGLVASRLHDFA
jgi:hypothetical protein